MPVTVRNAPVRFVASCCKPISSSETAACVALSVLRAWSTSSSLIVLALGSGLHDVERVLLNLHVLFRVRNALLKRAHLRVIGRDVA